LRNLCELCGKTAKYVSNKNKQLILLLNLMLKPFLLRSMELPLPIFLTHVEHVFAPNP